MWGRLAVAALLCSVALPAEAAPVVTFVSAIVGSISAAFAAGGVFAGGTLAGIAARAVLSIGLSALSRKLAGSQGEVAPPAPNEYLTNFAQAVSYMERGYGYVRKGGPLGFTGFADGARHYIVLIAAHPTVGPVEHWLDKRIVTLDGVNTVVEEPFYPYGSIQPYTGAAGQPADSVLEAAFPEFTSAHDFAGLSYARITARRPTEEEFSEVYPGGREWSYAPLWQMSNQIYDPRDASVGWTRNAALIIAHELVFFGKAVDWVEVAAEADRCDVLIENGDVEMQATWTINGIFRDDQDWASVRQQLMLACDAWFYERTDGKIGFKVGGYDVPTLTLTDEDFVAIEIAEAAYGPDVPRSFVVRYVEPRKGYIEAPCAPYVMGPGIARREESCFLIDNHNQAWRVARRMARAALAQFKVTGTVKLIGYEAIGERFLRIQHVGLGFDMIVEVARLARNAGGITFSLEAQSVTPEDFDSELGPEEPPRPGSAEVTSSDVLPDVTGLAGAEIVGAGAITWAWDAQPAGLRQQLRIQRVVGGLPIDAALLWAIEGQTTMMVGGLISGEEYLGQVRNRTSTGRVSAWAPVTPVSVTLS